MSIVLLLQGQMYRGPTCQSSDAGAVPLPAAEADTCRVRVAWQLGKAAESEVQSVPHLFKHAQVQVSGLDQLLDGDVLHQEFLSPRLFCEGKKTGWAKHGYTAKNKMGQRQEPS